MVLKIHSCQIYFHKVELLEEICFCTDCTKKIQRKERLHQMETEDMPKGVPSLTTAVIQCWQRVKVFL